jgi:hypothetical protein
MPFPHAARLAAIVVAPLCLVGIGAKSAFGTGGTSGTVHVCSVQQAEAVTTPFHIPARDAGSPFGIGNERHGLGGSPVAAPTNAAATRIMAARSGPET